MLLLIAQLSISFEAPNVVVSWPATNWTWSLQSSSGGAWETVTTAPETNGNQLAVRIPATDSVRFFRLVEATNTVFVRNGETNDFQVRVGQNQSPAQVWLVALTEPLPDNPTFMVRSGQARLFPPRYTDEGILRESESRGEYDWALQGYRVLVKIQDPITTPLVIRVIGGTQQNPYVAFGRFVNP